MSEFINRFGESEGVPQQDQNKVISGLQNNPEVLAELFKKNPDIFRECQEELKKEEDRKEKGRRKELENRYQELTSWLEPLKVKGLSAGEPHTRVPGLVESVGIYLDNKHTFDVFSRWLNFEQEEFIQEVKKGLKEKGIMFSEPSLEKKTKPEINFSLDISDPNLKDVLRNQGITIDIEENSLYLTKVPKGGNNFIDLYNGGENVFASLTVEDKNTILLTVHEAPVPKGKGRIIQYTIENGALDIDSRKELK